MGQASERAVPSTMEVGTHMKEYMLRILNQADHQKTWSSEQHLEFVRKCEVYIENLKKEGKLLAAQPLARTGKILSGKKGAWKEAPLGNTGEVQVGYYHIRAKDLDEAIAIAKGNPEFDYGDTARIEVRPIEIEEERTGFVYPK